MSLSNSQMSSEPSAKPREDHERVICFCNSNIPWGGGEAWHLNAALALAARGWRVLLVCHPDGELMRRALEYKQIRAVSFRIGRLSFLNPRLHLRLRNFFRRERVQAVIMNLPADLKTCGPAARAAGVRHVIYRRGSALPVRDSLLNRHLYGRVITRLIANSLATRQQVLANNPDLIPGDRITVLPNGVDVRAFDAALSGVPAGEWKQERSRPFVIGNAGRLNRQKGQHLLLQLCSLLRDSGLDFRLLIAGEGECEAELKELSSKLGLDRQVEFCGFVRNMAAFWPKIDLFVLTSLWEGFGNVLIEAMLAEKPVFAFEVSNIPELITEGPGGNGRLFPLPQEARSMCPDYGTAAGAGHEKPSGGEPVSREVGGQALNREKRETGGLQAMAAAILELAADPDEAKRMGKAGREFALGFSQEARMDALEALLGEK